MKPVLIIVGASVRAAAQSALRAGFAPYAIDLFADRDLAAICPAVRIKRYPRDFEPALRAAPQAPWIYTGGLENYPRLVARLAAIRPLWGTGPDTLRKIRNPWRLQRELAAINHQVPPIYRAMNADPRGPMLHKPLRSSGGFRIRPASAAGPLSARRGWYYQSQVAGQSLGAVFASTGEATVLLGVARQWQGHDFGLENLPLAYVGSYAGPEMLDHHQRLQPLGAAIAERFQLRGLWNVDLVADREKYWVLEVNPRYSASCEVLERATGVPLLPFHAAAFDSKHACSWSAPQPRPKIAVGKATVYAPRGGVVPQSFDDLIAKWNDAPHWPIIADLPFIGAKIVANQPVATVFSRGESRADVESALRERVQTVQCLIS